MNLKKKLRQKTDEIEQFRTKNTQFKKSKFLFIKNNITKKLISRHNMAPNTLTRREYQGKIYVENIRKFHEGS